MDSIIYKSASVRINKLPNDKVSSFIQAHSHRFDYITNKSLSEMLKTNFEFDSTFLNQKFCSVITADSFYQNFSHLTSGNKTKREVTLSFSKPELMKIASRFFSCDKIQEKDTAISYFICVGINGISELEVSRDYTVLEAFCFEAIFKNSLRKAKFIQNFHNYIDEASNDEKRNFKDFKSHLSAVKKRCFALMEKDKDLENAIMAYYNKNKANINFKIE